MAYTFSEKLHSIRTEAGLSQQDLAEKLHVTRQAVSCWELGKSEPDLTMISLLAETLGVEPASFLPGEADSQEAGNADLLTLPESTEKATDRDPADEAEETEIRRRKCARAAFWTVILAFCIFAHYEILPRIVEYTNRTFKLLPKWFYLSTVKPLGFFALPMTVGSFLALGENARGPQKKRRWLKIIALCFLFPPALFFLESLVALFFEGKAAALEVLITRILDPFLWNMDDFNLGFCVFPAIAGFLFFLSGGIERNGEKSRL